MDIWNAVGLILTFVGTGLSFWQAYKAKGYKEEIQADRERLALIEMRGIAKMAREECQKIITQVSGKPIRGVDPQVVINKIQDLFNILKENQHRFADVEYPRLIAALDAALNLYRQTADVAERHRIADGIHACINNILSLVQRLLDDSI